jgi:hypothetical protein
MTRLKRFIRPGFVISAVGHGSVLILWLLFVIGANSSQQQPPPPAIPPDAMVVDIVPPKDPPRLEGTPSDSAVSGTQAPLKSNAPNLAAPPPPKPAAPAPRAPSNPAHNADPKTAQPEKAEDEMAQAAMALPLAARAEAAHRQMPPAETAPPELAKIETSEPRLSPPQPDAVETQAQPDAEETVARLALLGGALGGGFQAPPINAPTASHDFTVAFRERVSACSVLPAELSFGDKTAVSLRVSFNLDGTLAAPPKSNGAIASPKERALLESSIRALEKCQPYTMLPPEKYRIWKTLDLVFSPMNFPDR